MSLLVYFWNHLLYIPLFNVLIWLYNGLAHENLGIAVIYLTIALRVVLLPLSVVSERNKVRYLILEQKVSEARKSFKNDPVALKERVRKFLKEYKINPWAKTVVLGVQALVLVLLYQVFIGGITRYKMNVLYAGIARPEVLNTKFHGFELGLSDWRWAAAVGIILFLELYLAQRRKEVSRTEQLYAIFFPLMSFVLLWILPMVKSVFILTTLAFSFMLGMFRSWFYPSKK